MSNFKKFQNDILSLPGIWRNKKDIYFSQMKDGYSAAYKPQYPNSSNADKIIQTIDRSGAYLRGKYELIIYLENKFTALYFQDIEQLRKYFTEAQK